MCLLLLVAHTSCAVRGWRGHHTLPFSKKLSQELHIPEDDFGILADTELQFLLCCAVPCVACIPEEQCVVVDNTKTNKWIRCSIRPRDSGLSPTSTREFSLL